MPAMSEQPVLVVRRLTHTEPLACRCTLCGQLFMFPEGRSVKEGVAELWAAFDEHVRQVHGAVNHWRGVFHGAEHNL